MPWFVSTLLTPCMQEHACHWRTSAHSEFMTTQSCRTSCSGYSFAFYCADLSKANMFELLHGSKVVHYKGNRVPFGTHPKSATPLAFKSLRLGLDWSISVIGLLKKYWHLWLVKRPISGKKIRMWLPVLMQPQFCFKRAVLDQGIKSAHSHWSHGPRYCRHY